MNIIKNFKDESITFDDLDYGAIFTLEDGDGLWLKVYENDKSMAAMVLESSDYTQFEIRYFIGNFNVKQVYSSDLIIYE